MTQSPLNPPPARRRWRDTAAGSVAMKLYRWIARPKIILRDRLVVVDESDRCTNPIFLVGVMRSGTTLMRQIVDSHSRIACPPETFFLERLSKMLEEPAVKDGLLGLGFDHDSAVAGIRRSAGFFFDAYAKSKGKPRWADKTPSYVFCLPFIEQMFGEGSRYVMIYRHPLDILDSLARKGWNFMTYHADPLLNQAKYIDDGLTRMKRFAESHAHRCHDVHYEKLMAEPEPVLRAMFDFLGEPWEPRVMEFYRQPHDWGVGDPSAQVLKGFSPSVDHWKTWDQREIDRAMSILGPWVAKLGYSV